MALSFTVSGPNGAWLPHVSRHLGLSGELPCQREPGNSHDPFSVAIVRAGVIVGHVPRKILSLFLRRGGLIHCRVTGSRHYSEDLPQGGLEIPCLSLFEGGAKKCI